MIQVLGSASIIEARNILLERSAPSDLRTHSVNRALVPSAVIMSRPIVFLGGVYEDNKLEPLSTLTRCWAGSQTARTASYKSLPLVTKKISGDAVFGGYLFAHFGHFMLESMSRIWWAIDNNFKGPIIFQVIGTQIPDFVRTILSLAELNPIFIMSNDCLEIERLIVPEAALVERAWAHCKFLSPFEKIYKNIMQNSYSQKSQFLYVLRGSGVRPVSGEHKVILALKSCGFDVLDPTTASIEDQILAFANAKVIVGCIGSAMHNIVYAKNAKKVIYLARSNSVSPSYPIIDRCIGTFESSYIYSALPSSFPVDSPLFKFQIDADTCLSMLSELGLIGG